MPRKKQEIKRVMLTRLLKEYVWNLQTGRHVVLIDNFSGKVCIGFNPDRTRNQNPSQGLHTSICVDNGTVYEI